MLLWINGPFGGGKSETARELRSRLPGSVICDPEEPMTLIEPGYFAEIIGRLTDSGSGRGHRGVGGPCA
jgi:hypothetical protein